MEFTQVCVWPGTMVADKEIQDFEDFFLTQFNTHVKFIESIVTKPDLNDPSTGGRHDVLFYVDTKDIGHFALQRFSLGVRWLEDVLDNEEDGYSIYPDYVAAYRTW